MANILVSDNNPAYLAAMVAALQDINPMDGTSLVVDQAGSLADATGLIADAGRVWDVVVVDLRLCDDEDGHDYSGWELMRQVLSSRSDSVPRVILVTSFPETQIGGKPVGLASIHEGAYAFIPRARGNVDWGATLRYAVSAALAPA